MPHFDIQYSANLDRVVDIDALCEAIRATAAEIDTFPTAGIRVCATRVDFLAIADGNPQLGFIDLSIRLREGRPDDVKNDATARIFARLNEYMTPAMETHSIALSAEMRNISAEFSPKFGTIRDHLEDKA